MKGQRFERACVWGAVLPIPNPMPGDLVRNEACLKIEAEEVTSSSMCRSKSAVELVKRSLFPPECSARSLRGLVTPSGKIPLPSWVVCCEQ